MNIYMAACYAHGLRNRKRNDSTYAKLDDVEKAAIYSSNFLLESYHYCKTQNLTNIIKEDETPIFLDSGAFSAYTLGVNLSVAEYCNYIIQNKDFIRNEDGVMLASVLDGIGDPLQTWRNQNEMELRGVRPLPCFHAGEDERFLEHYIKNYEYITLGGLVPLGKEVAIKWLDRIWDNYLIDGSGKAKLKVHAFGVTSIEIMERYPWHSCDSSSWVQFSAFGHIVLGDTGTIFVSEKSATKHIQGKHLWNISQIEQNYLLDKIKARGYDVERLSKFDYSRYAFNIEAYRLINEQINAKQISFKNPIQELY